MDSGDCYVIAGMLKAPQHVVKGIDGLRDDGARDDVELGPVDQAEQCKADWIVSIDFGE